MIKNTKDKVLTIIFTLLILYFIISLLGGNRGLFSYFEKKNFLTKLEYEKITLSQEIEELEKSNALLSDNLDIDYITEISYEMLGLIQSDQIVIDIKK